MSGHTIFEDLFQSAREQLPPSVVELVDVVGSTAAALLLSKYSGTEVRLPSVPSTRRSPVRERLDLLIGCEASEKFLRRFGGDLFTFPSCRAARAYLRDRRVIAEFSAGKQPNDIARAEGISVRHVKRILKRPI